MKNYSILVLVTLMSLVSACSDKSFSVGPASDKTANLNGGAVCSDQLRDQVVPVKIVLVVDTSGSNAGGSSSAGTDPNKSMRGQALQSFFERYRTAGNFSWSFLIFSDDQAYSLIGGSYLTPGFSNRPQDMSNAIQSFYGVDDYGNTPFRAALSMSRQAIQGDWSRTADTKYVVVFISDGVPDPAVSNQTLQSDVSSILGQAPGQVTLNTIYYGPYSQSASNRLLLMANSGNGRFLDANQSSGQTIDIESVVQVPGVVCPN